jgi:hypothetical protein
VTLHADRLAWTESHGTSHTLPYVALNDLRIEAGGTGAAKLSAADTHGRRWTLALADTDVARAQAALDVIDARLRPAPVGAGVWRTIGVLVSLMATVAALGAGQLASVVVALLASSSFERPLARAAGVAGLVGGAVALRDGGHRGFALILILSAALLLFIASRDRREGNGRWTAYAVAALGALALLTLLPLALGAGGFLAAHQIANRWPAAAVFALAFAAAAAWPRRRRWRAAALAGAAAGATVLVLGDTRTLDAVLRDPFLQKVDQPPVVQITGEPSSRATFSFTPERVLLSPRAQSVAAFVHSEDYEEATLFIGRTGAALTEVDADAARFVDERHVLLTDASGTGTRLRLIDTDRPAVSIWESALDVERSSISVDRAGRQWQVLGQGAKGGVVQFTGAMNGGAVDRREWLSQSDRVNQPWPLWAAGSRLLVRATNYDSSMFAALGAFRYWLRPFNSETRFAIVEQTRASDVFQSGLHVQCEPGAFIDEGPVCSAHDGSRFHLGVVDTAAAAVTPLAKFTGAMTFQVAPGWIVGWWNTPFALDRETGRLVTMTDRRGAGGRPYMMTASEESIGVLWWDRSNPGQTILEIYPRRAVFAQ